MAEQIFTQNGFYRVEDGRFAECLVRATSIIGFISYPSDTALTWSRDGRCQTSGFKADLIEYLGKEKPKYENVLFSFSFNDNGKQKYNSCTGYLTATMDHSEILSLHYFGENEEESRQMLINQAKDLSQALIQFLKRVDIKK
jgi:hypothetical protein